VLRDSGCAQRADVIYAVYEGSAEEHQCRASFTGLSNFGRRRRQPMMHTACTVERLLVHRPTRYRPGGTASEGCGGRRTAARPGPTSRQYLTRGLRVSRHRLRTRRQPSTVFCCSYGSGFTSPPTRSHVLRRHQWPGERDSCRRGQLRPVLGSVTMLADYAAQTSTV